MMNELTMTAAIEALKIEFREMCVGHYPLAQIKKTFQDFEFDLKHKNLPTNITRRELIDEIYASVDWNDPETAKRFIGLINYFLHLHYVDDDSRNYLISRCEKLGFQIKNNKIYFQNLFVDNNEDLFVYQFPAGMPFGLQKPGMLVAANQGKQDFKFVLQDGLGIIKEKVYPNLTFGKLASFYNITKEDNNFPKSIYAMNQTLYEKYFFMAYARGFSIREQEVPMLIPQAWIQWNSQTRQELRSTSAKHSDEVYRVDFVAFWKNKRYVILVDDIGHYAKKIDSNWHASEESYANRLKEDRKLRQEGWQVFRLSNWELRSKDRLYDILKDLQHFIGFEGTISSSLIEKAYEYHKEKIKF